MRLFDASGRDVGYLLMRNPPAVPDAGRQTPPGGRRRGDKERTSGFEADLGRAADR